MEGRFVRLSQRLLQEPLIDKFIFNQRDETSCGGETFSITSPAGRFTNVLASTTEDLDGEKGWGLLGYRITGVTDERLEDKPPTNHSSILDRVLENRLVESEVQGCLK